MDDKGGSGGGKVTSAPSGALKIEIVYSPEKEKMLLPLVAKFNGEKHEVDGKQLFVDAKNVSSGDAKTQIVKGQLKPDRLVAGVVLLGRLANLETDSGLGGRRQPVDVRTPLVIAMWKPMAGRSAGRRSRSSSSRSSSSRPPGRLGSVGGAVRPFKHVHTNPDFSTSGPRPWPPPTSRRRQARGPDERRRARPAPSVKKVESSIVHYGDNTLFIADQLKQHGQGYASAVAMEEATLLEFNRTQPAGSPKLVALYPSEGTFVSDNPYRSSTAMGVGLAAKGRREFEKFLADQLHALARRAVRLPPGRQGQKRREWSPPPRAPTPRSRRSS